MKMANGGYRPGFNVQLATAGAPMGGPRTIVAVRVTNVGSDMRTLQTVVEQIEERAGVLPQRVLADANHANHSHIDALEKRGVELFIPPQRHSRTTNRLGRKKLTPEQERWIERMQTPEAKQVYRARASLAELPNAMFRWRYGLEQFLVRGAARVTTTALLIAVTHNLLTHAPKLL